MTERSAHCSVAMAASRLAKEMCPTECASARLEDPASFSLCLLRTNTRLNKHEMATKKKLPPASEREPMTGMSFLLVSNSANKGSRPLMVNVSQTLPRLILRYAETTAQRCSKEASRMGGDHEGSFRSLKAQIKPHNAAGRASVVTLRRMSALRSSALRATRRKHPVGFTCERYELDQAGWGDAQ